MHRLVDKRSGGICRAIFAIGATGKDAQSGPLLGGKIYFEQFLIGSQNELLVSSAETAYLWFTKLHDGFTASDNTIMWVFAGTVLHHPKRGVGELATNLFGKTFRRGC